MENLPCFKAVFDEIDTAEELSKCLATLPDFLLEKNWESEQALREIVRGRLEGLGPVTAERLALELNCSVAKIDSALIALEVEGYAFQGQFTPQLKQAVIANGNATN